MLTRGYVEHIAANVGHPPYILIPIRGYVEL